jgi:hypothetical protein
MKVLGFREIACAVLVCTACRSRSNDSPATHGAEGALDAPVTGPAALPIAAAGRQAWDDRCFGEPRKPAMWDVGDLQAAIAEADLAIAGAAAGPRNDGDIHGRDDGDQERRARDSVARAASGDLVGAREGVAALPPTWSVYSDPFGGAAHRWLGSPAMAACMSLVPDAAARATGARELVEAAEAVTRHVNDDWRRNREWRAIATAWARVGDPERALAAAVQMPGSERAELIGELVRDLGPDVPADRFARLVAGARAALATKPGTPLVIPDRADGPSKELTDVVQGSIAGEVEAALVVALVARGDLDGAQAGIARIPDNLAAHARALGAYACGLARAKRAAPSDAISFAEAYVSGLADAGCGAEARAFAGAGGDVLARQTIAALLADSLVDDAADVYADHRAGWDGAPGADQLCLVLDALARAGRVDHARLLLAAEPPAKYPLIRQEISTCGLRVVPAMVRAGRADEARRLRDRMEARAGG